MTLDKTGINILNVASGYTTLKKTGSYNGEEWRGACPVCGGTDRFHVWPLKDRCWCRQCGLSGDAIQLVQAASGLDFRAACDALGVALDDSPPRRTTPVRRPQPKPQPPAVPDIRKDYLAFDDRWQAAAKSFIAESVDNLHKNPDALNYLIRRGISIGMIGAAMLGFNPRERWSRWAGVNVWLPRGIVIPWVTGVMNVWRIRFRALDDKYQHHDVNGMKYPQVKGSANGLYFAGLSASVTARDKVIMAEGEFDALAVHSAIPHALRFGYRAVATGGVNNARVRRWVNTLARAKKVYLAFDAHETAGPLCALWWAGVLPNAQRIQPLSHDLNQMVVEGRDIYKWLGIDEEVFGGGQS